ncbi:hypothetical protein B9Z65_5881 [Elsinoe australis]|uniref:Uncharacterized protein n=1 Tax=Elsinoe australis TaxID=40998 RepID=A0A2P7YJC1_9PEZI|nr:hypothetical protein B9Z65_5881 [Elsinoe australis]
MAAVMHYRQDSLEMPHLDRGHRSVEPFDINELCRRLEAYRLETKMEQVRQRSRQLQDKRSSKMTYEPRYASRLSLLPGEPQRPTTSVGETKSRRQSRYISDSSDKSDKSDEDDRVDSGRSSQWVNPKSLLAARQQGMSSSEALHHITQQHTREDDEFTKARKNANRRSWLNREPSTRSSRSPHGDSRKSRRTPSPSKKSRPLSTAFDNFTMPDLRSLAPPVPRITEDEKKKNHRKSWRPQPADRNDWTQASQTCRDDDVERETFLSRLARRKSVFPPKDAARQSSKTPASAADKQGTKRPGTFTRHSADSAVSISAQKEKDKNQTSPKRRKSLFDLFRRNRS